jgi:paraquat-inducible protein A
MNAFSKLSARNKSAFLISLLAYFFFFPGIYLSMLTISTKGTIEANVQQAQHSSQSTAKADNTEQKKMSINIFDTTRSILKTVHDLWDRDYYFVASMIILFSVIVPLFKGALLTMIFFSKNSKLREKVFLFTKSIGKWSMCDVFIVAIMLAYLSTGAAKTENVKNITMMGYPVNVDVLTGMHANLHVGFWCFLTYCLLSLIALQLYETY